MSARKKYTATINHLKLYFYDQGASAPFFVTVWRMIKKGPVHFGPATVRTLCTELELALFSVSVPSFGIAPPS